MEAPINDFNESGQVSGAHSGETSEKDVPLACLWFLLSFNLECAWHLNYYRNSGAITRNLTAT
jgi:hypothetical protein